VSPSKIRLKIFVNRASWIRKMLDGIRALPLDDVASFESDPRNLAAADSYLRRGLEALLDLGRHVAAKGFGEPVVEYKEIARMLSRLGVIDSNVEDKLLQLAGYRNRLVHFYDQVSSVELFEICSHELGDIELVLAAITQWVDAHPDRTDREL
jgi:uncharacterized protein YutE (UPF0331/DUF86 family)